MRQAGSGNERSRATRSRADWASAIRREGPRPETTTADHIQARGADEGSTGRVALQLTSDRPLSAGSEVSHSGRSYGRVAARFCVGPITIVSGRNQLATE